MPEEAWGSRKRKVVAPAAGPEAEKGAEEEPGGSGLESAEAAAAEQPV